MLHGGLPAQFADECAGTLVERAPGAALVNAPHQKIKLAGVRGIDHLRVVGAEGGQLNLAQVRGAHRRRTVVSLQDGVAVIHIAQAEHA